MRLAGHSPGLVRKMLRGQRTGVFRVRESSLQHDLAWPDVFMSSGLLAITTAPICGVASSCGALGGRSGLLEWATRHRRAETSDAQSLKRVPSARSIARLVSHRRDAVSSFADAVTKLRPLSRAAITTSGPTGGPNGN